MYVLTGSPRAISITVLLSSFVARAVFLTALSNLVFSDLDEKLGAAAAEFGLSYSRYADDLSFSSLRPITPNFLKQVAAVLNEKSFRLNPSKIRFAGPSQAKFVTGFVVNRRVQVQRHLRRRLRAMFHQAALQPEQFRQRGKELMGWASFVKSYDRDLGLKYLDIAERLV